MKKILTVITVIAITSAISYQATAAPKEKICSTTCTTLFWGMWTKCETTCVIEEG